MTVAPPSHRATVRRRAGRGRYDRSEIDAILDAGFAGHVGIAVEGQPYVLPVTYARSGDEVLLHGSPLSRLLAGLADGCPACFTVTLLDGLVLARSAFHHSVNYRSVMVLGTATVISEPDRKAAALRSIVDHALPGRSAEARAPSDAELAATEVIAMPLDEASAKVRSGPPVDAADDMGLPVWAGELPLALTAGPPVADARCALPIPDYVHAHRERHP